MAAIALTSDDLVKMRFSFSPLMELVTSFRVLLNPSYHTLYQPWLDETCTTLEGERFPYLSALIPRCGSIPDFITPVPETSAPSFEEEIYALRHTEPDRMMNDVRQLRLEGPVIRELYNDPCAALDGLILEIQRYWRLALAHHWPRMRAVLEGDVLYRARQMAMSGPGELLKDLHQGLHYEEGLLGFQSSFPMPEGDEAAYQDRMQKWMTPYDRTDEGGLVLMPVIFSWPKVYIQMVPQWRPMVAYNARGAGLWTAAAPEPVEALQITLGAGRASVLQNLATPTSTSELAQRLYITPGAVSQHLSKLSQAGLVNANRVGKHVYYRLSSRGQQLLDLFGVN